VIYYNVSYRTYLPGEPLADVFHYPLTSTQQASLTQFGQQWANRGQDPKGTRPASRPSPARRSSPSSAAAPRWPTCPARASSPAFACPSAPTPATACQCPHSLPVGWLGFNSVDAPLGAFFGCGYPPANAQALAMGTNNGQMYSYFPMPYTNGAVIEIVNPSSTPINANFTITYVPKTAAQIGRYRFHADGHSQTPVSGGSPSYRI